MVGSMVITLTKLKLSAFPSVAQVYPTILVIPVILVTGMPLVKVMELVNSISMRGRKNRAFAVLNHVLPASKLLNTPAKVPAYTTGENVGLMASDLTKLRVRPALLGFQLPPPSVVTK